MENQHSSLTDEVKQLKEIMQLQNKLGRRFLLGIVFGLGSALGASFVAALVVYILSRVLNVAGLDVGM